MFQYAGGTVVGSSGLFEMSPDYGSSNGGNYGNYGRRKDERIANAQVNDPS